MDDEATLGPRARRALPLMAAALAVILVASLLYLRPQGSRKILGAPPVPQLDSRYRVAYDFVDGAGWAVVVSAGRNPAFSVFSTSDSARHWHKQFTGTTLQGADPSIQFLDHKSGILRLDPVYRTVDGGAQWGVISIPDDSPSFTFVSPTHAWALDGYQLFETADGGLTWQMRGAIPPSITGLFTGGPHPVAVGATGVIWVSTIDQGAPIVYGTSDRGMTWQAIAVPFEARAVIPGGKPVFYSSFAQAVPGGGVLVVTNDVFGNYEGAVSFDMGRSWKRTQLPTQQPYLDVFSFLDTRAWWVSDPGLLLYRTEDGGQTWHGVRTVVADSLNDWTFESAHMVDAKHGWALITLRSSSGLALTSDGGVHWSAVNVPRPG